MRTVTPRPLRDLQLPREPRLLERDPPIAAAASRSSSTAEAHPGGSRPVSVSRSSRPTARRCRANAYPDTPRPALPLPLPGHPGGDVEQHEVQAAAPPPGLARQPAPHPGLRTAVVHDDEIRPSAGAATARRSARCAPGGGRGRTGVSGAGRPPSGPWRPGSRSRAPRPPAGSASTCRCRAARRPPRRRPPRSPGRAARGRRAPQITHHRSVSAHRLPGGCARLPGHRTACRPRVGRVALQRHRPPPAEPCRSPTGPAQEV